MKINYLDRSKQHRLVTFAAPRYAPGDFYKKFHEYRAKRAPHLKAYALEIEEDSVPLIWDKGLIDTIYPRGALLSAPASCAGITGDYHNGGNYRLLAEKYSGND